MNSTKHSSVNLFLSFSLLFLLFNPKNMCPLLLSSSFETKLFDLKSLHHGYLTFLGDSHHQDRAIALTKEDMMSNAPKSAGAVLYRHPLDPHSKQVPSFYTMFAFSIQNYGDEEALGDGLAFLISPHDDILGSPGYMGLVDSTDPTRNKFVAIEFDTKRDSIFHDPDDNHVGLDVNSLFSIKTATSSSLGVDLKSANLIFTWINYESNKKRLEVFLSYSSLKPKTPLLRVDIDLSKCLKEDMFVGFSAAANGSRQLTYIDQWEFTIVELSPPPPPISTAESGRTFRNPSESEHGHSHLRFVIGLTVGVCSVPFILLFGWICRKKLMGMIQKSEGTNNLELQTIRSSGGISCQEILFSFLVDEVAKGLNLEKVLESEPELIRVKTVKSSIPLCNNLPAVKPASSTTVCH